MSHWNYRVVRHDDKGQPWYAIHEAYYDENNRVESITQESVKPGGETLQELQEDLKWMLKGMAAPVLDYDKIPEEG